MTSEAPCSACKADCCQYVPMTNSEFRNLQRAKPKVIHSAYINRIGFDSIMISGKCPWLGEDNKCSAYFDRPEICKLVGTKERPCHRMPGGMEKINGIVNRLKREVKRGKN